MNPGFDPQTLPVIETFPHLSPVPAGQLSPASLRERFLNPPDWQPERLGDRAVQPSTSSAAAVLIPVVTHPQPTILLTRRTSHLKAHAGQISFPGGRAEPHDASPAHTALREAHEEVGLPPDAVEVLGPLPAYTTVTGFVVTPIVGLVRPPLSLRPDPFEVDEAFEVPLAFLMAPAHHERRGIEAGQARHDFFAMPWRGPSATGDERDYFIWGATAAMLRNFYRFLAA